MTNDAVHSCESKSTYDKTAPSNATDYATPSIFGRSHRNDAPVSPPPEPSSCTSLQRSIPSSPAAAASDARSPVTAAADAKLARERQTLLIMLLGQLCSLHDPTPRTFVVHVIALYENGILDSESIRFLFDLGLVPRGYDFNRIGGEGTGRGASDNLPRRMSSNNFVPRERESSDPQREATREEGWESRDLDFSANQGAIVPYCAEAKEHPWTRSLPPPPLASSKSESIRSGPNQIRERSMNESSHSKKMAHRHREASAIRKHLERHESIESSGRGSIFDSANLSHTAEQHVPTSMPSSASDRWERANSTNTSSTSVSAVESFNNPSLRPQRTELGGILDDATVNQLSAPAPPPSASWSVEHHPLSLSRYQREFHQLSLLATGSFGSVYRALHKLERRQYAVKRVTFSTAGYYADALALVVREVRILARLDHPNCVRYYTSWLEPSWFTGDNREVGEDDGREDAEEEKGRGYPTARADDDGAGGGPRLLTDIERVVKGLHNAGAIDESVEQLEAILYGEGSDDGFDWATSSSMRGQRSAYSFDSSSEQKESFRDGQGEQWANIASRRMDACHSAPSFGTADGSSDSDASEWTQDMSNGVGSNVTRSYNNSRVLARQGSLELVRAGGGGGGRDSRRNHHRRKVQDCFPSVTYKYQISLYIQMQLCNPSTLADWIKNRNGACADFDSLERQASARPAFEAFRQIVNGLAHVHSKGIIHRDLKPANIFAGEDGAFRLGDFGLSKMMRDAAFSVDVDDGPQTAFLPGGFCNGIHTAGVGTASYASPEQIATKTYGTAADIYSLGLILLELFSNFTSEHERARAFHDCRDGREVAPWMRRHYPEVSALVLACTEADWTRRPSAADIQAAGLFQERGNGAEIFRAELRALKTEMTRKDHVIRGQRDQMKEKDEIIEDLRCRLAELERRGVPLERGPG